MKREFPLRNTEPGQIGWVIGLWFLLFLGVLLCVSLQLEVYRSAAVRLEDTLAASNLAAAVVDWQEYGTTHQVLIDDPDKALQRFCFAVQGNLGLNDAWENAEIDWLQGPVQVVKFIVYNVTEEETVIYERKSDGRMSEGRSVAGTTTAPNGKPVEATGIYSELSFQTKGLFGIEVTAHKGKLVDIVRKEESNGEEKGKSGAK